MMATGEEILTGGCDSLRLALPVSADASLRVTTYH